MPDKSLIPASEKNSATAHNRLHPDTRASHHQAEHANAADALHRAMTAPARSLLPSDILALQRAAGNGAVEQFLNESLQNQQQSRLAIQAKLVVGAADDPYEREADRVAESVVQTSESAVPRVQRQTSDEEDEEMIQTKPLASSITPLIQCQEAEDDDEIQTKRTSPGIGFEADSHMEGRLGASKGSGHPLPEGVRSQMELSFGADFGDVRVHTDGQAAELNRELSAQAFTQGADIYFREGSYNPGTVDGKQLLAHELTHVVQQRGAKSKPRVGGKTPEINRLHSKRLQRKSWFKSKWEELKKKHWSTLPPDQRTSYLTQKTASFGESMGSALSAAAHPKEIAEAAGRAGISIDASPDSLVPKSLGGIGATGGVLGTAAGLINVGSGIQNIRHELKEAEKGDESWWKRRRFWSRGVGRTGAGLAQTASGVTTAAKGISAAANVSSPALQVLASAALPAQIAMSGVGAIKGGYKAFKASRAISKISELQEENKSYGRSYGQNAFEMDEVGKLGDLVKKYHSKRKWAGISKLISGLAAGVGGVLTLTGIGGVLGIPLMIAGGLGGFLSDRKKSQALSEADANRMVKLAEKSRLSGNFEEIMKTISPELLDLYNNPDNTPQDREVIIRAMLERA